MNDIERYLARTLAQARLEISKLPLRKVKMPNSHTERLDNAMDNLQLYAPPQSEVILGVYGSEDWVISTHLRQRIVQNKTTVQIDITWLVPVAFKLPEWAASTDAGYTFFSANRVLIQEEGGLLKVTSGRGKIEVEHMGDPAWAAAWVARFDMVFKRAESMIEWVYSDRGDEIRVPLNYRPAVKSAYPWIDRDLFEYMDEYLNSSISVLILLGRPGTGKTTFIKNLIHRSGGNAKVAYDEKVMMADSLFATFISDDSRFLIMEDADAFLQSRADGNTMMHRFLNVSDGLISAADKKLVFSTNLPNIQDIDRALVRPGRCFDVLEFRPLTVPEAKAVIAESGSGSLPEGKSQITLAEIFSAQPSAGNSKKKGAGFV